MKKVFFSRYSVIALTVVFLFSCFVFVVERLEARGIYLYMGSALVKIDMFGVPFLIFLFAGAVFLIGVVGRFMYQNWRFNRLRVVTAAVTAVVVFIAFLGLAVTASLLTDSYAEFASDDGEHRIVIGEDDIPPPSGGFVYEKTSFATMKLLGEYNTVSKFYTPFSEGEYYFVWNENDFELHYDYDGEGNYAVATFRYAEK